MFGTVLSATDESVTTFAAVSWFAESLAGRVWLHPNSGNSSIVIAMQTLDVMKYPFPSLRSRTNRAIFPNMYS